MVDLEVNELTLAGMTLKIQVFGSWCRETSTFLWGWANPSPDWSDECKRLSKQVRELGETQDVSLFKERKHSMAKRETFNMLVALCGYFDEAHAIHEVIHQKGSLYVFITDTQVELPPPSTLRLTRVIIQAIGMWPLNHKLALETYATQRGFQLTKNGLTWKMSLASGAGCEIALDEMGRINSIGATARGGP